MVVRKTVLALTCFFVIAAGVAQAQSDARIRVVLPNIDEPQADLEWVVELSPNPTLKKQGKRLSSEIITAFTEGLDTSKPVEMDLVFKKDELSYEYYVPYGKLKTFTENIEGMGFKFPKEKKPTENTQTQFSERNKKPYYFKASQGYAWITGQQGATPPNPAISTILASNQGKDIIAELTNDAAGLESRRETFKELRKQFEALIKFRRNEDKNAFELRKQALTQQLDEAERFIVESEKLHVSWTTTAKSPDGKARGDFSLTALPGTDLRKSIEQLAEKPSYFANVVTHENPLVVSKMNFPIDPLRTRHLKDFVKTVRPILDGEIDKRPGTSDAQRAAIKKGTTQFLDMIDEGADMGMVDNFIDAYAVEPGKNVLIAGMRVADGKKFDDIIKLLPEMQDGWQVSAGATEHGGVSIHEVTIPSTRLESFQRIFKGETKFLVGTTKDAIWVAAGIDALTHLKEAIDQSAKPAPEKASPVVISYHVQLAKLITLLEIIQKESPAMNPANQKDVDKFRKMAQETMGDCPSLMHGELKRTDNQVDGFIEFNECVLRFIGSSIADTIKSMLQ